MQIRATLAVGLVVSLVALDAKAQEKASFVDAKDAMRGLRYIQVLVEDIPELKTSVTPEILKTEVELRLRQSAIQVPDEKDANSGIFPRLYLNVNVLESANSDLLVYSISMEFSRYLILPSEDDNTSYIRASVWDCGSVGRAGRSRVQSIKQGVDDCVTSFLNDYLKANPRR